MLNKWCKNRKRSDRAVVGLATIVCSAAWRNCTFNGQEGPQNEVCNGGLQSLSNVQPALCWVADLTYQRPIFQKLEQNLKGKSQGTNNWKQGNNGVFAAEQRYLFVFLANNGKIVNCNQKQIVPCSSKTMKSVTCSGKKLKLSSTLSGSPTRSRRQHFPVVSCLEVKTNIGT